jgi:predicted DNA-binding protein
MRPIEIPHSVTHMPLMSASAATRLEPMLIRLPPELAAGLRRLARSTRIRQSDYLREAVSDLLAKYGDLSAAGESASP